MQKKVYPLYFVLPALILYTALYIYPSLVGVGYSFTDWNRYTSDVHFVGLKTLKRLYLQQALPAIHLEHADVHRGLQPRQDHPGAVPGADAGKQYAGHERVPQRHVLPYILSTLVVCLIFQP